VTFREVFGHDRVLERLRRSLAVGRVAHAYLFVGPAGVGKATVARAFSAALTCPEEPGEGCGECPSCLRLEAATHPDVHVVEPDGQEVKIEQVRGLQRALAYRPSMARCAVAIIPQAERLNLPAANALLKTLEEPPGETVLVLVSPAASLLPPTVVSRCEQVSFTPLPQEELASFLVSRRGLTAEAAALTAALAAGRVGLALEAEVGDLKALRERAWQFVKAAAEGPGSVLAWSQHGLEEMRQGRSSLKAAGLELNTALLSLARDVVVSAAGQPERLIHADLAGLYASLPAGGQQAAAQAVFEAVQVGRAQLGRNLNPQLVYETMGLTIAEANRGRK
jgi:DNA polymerase-3 subunit delta'